MTPNKSLQLTFDPPPLFAAAKSGVASNAAELRRWAQEDAEDAPVLRQVIDISGSGDL